MKKIIFTSFIMIGLVVAGKFVFAAETAAVPDNSSSKLFQAKCASCHGKDGKGNAPMAKAFKVDPSALSLTTKAVAEAKDEVLTAVTANGKGKMPAYKDKLKKEEIESLTAYIRTLAPK